jgi:hypothetical protein
MHHPSVSAERLAGLYQNIVKALCFRYGNDSLTLYCIRYTHRRWPSGYSSGFIRRAVLFIHRLGYEGSDPGCHARRVALTGLQGARGLRFEYLKGAGFQDGVVRCALAHRAISPRILRLI